MRFEPMMRELYKFYFPTNYETWINDKTKDKEGSIIARLFK